VAKGASKASETNYGIGQSYSEGYQGQGGQIASAELPFLQNELTNPQGFGQSTVNQMITQGGQATAGATGAAKEAALLNASRTGNTAAVPGVIDNTTRSAMQQQSNNVLNTNLANANLKQQQQQEGVSGLESMYGTDVSAALQSLGLSNQAIGEWTSADKLGAEEWQDLEQDANQIAEEGATHGAVSPTPSGGAVGCWIAAAAFGEDLSTGKKTNLVRDWLWREWIKHWYAKPVLALYSRFGERLAKSRFIVRLLTPLFEMALREARNA
jgi:hypothetical protein